MAKRFTDTDKWNKAWYRKLGSKYRDIWTYLTDQCSHAGIWEIDLETLAHFTGQKVSIAELEGAFGERISTLPDNKLFLRTFFEFQYGSSRNDFKAKHSALEVLKKYSLLDDSGNLLNSFPKSSEHSGVLSECTSKSIGIGIGKSNTGESEGGPTRQDWEKVADLWPKSEGRTEGVNRLMARFSTWGHLRYFEQCLRAAIAELKRNRTDPKYIKAFDRFVGIKGSEPWRDYVSKVVQLKKQAPPISSAVVYDGTSVPASDDPRSNDPEEHKRNSEKLKALISKSIRPIADKSDEG